MRNLTKGERYNFEVELFDCDELFIEMDNYKIPMKKVGTIFKRENVYIHGNSVKISAIHYIEGSTSYYYAEIYGYNTIGNDVEYPYEFKIDLNYNLFSPMKAKLTRGNTYEFKIQCDELVKLEILFCGIIQFERNRDFYTKTFKIEESCSSSKLYIYYKTEMGSYVYLFSYDIE